MPRGPRHFAGCSGVKRFVKMGRLSLRIGPRSKEHLVATLRREGMVRKCSPRGHRIRDLKKERSQNSRLSLLVRTTTALLRLKITWKLHVTRTRILSVKPLKYRIVMRRSLTLMKAGEAELIVSNLAQEIPAGSVVTCKVSR